MVDEKNIKKLFPFFANNPDEIYFDSAATTLKPQIVIDGVVEYYSKYGTNPHNTDSDLAFQTYQKFNQIRKKVQKFINAKDSNEIVFTSGTTFALNQIAFGLEDTIQPGDEILITYQEHGSNILPWYRLAKNKAATVNFIPLKNHTPDLSALSKMINEKTKVIAFANISNILGYEIDVVAISQKIRALNPNIIIVVDCAQGILHTKTDVQKWDVDFICFSAHKMFGPTGVGVLWGKIDHLKALPPLMVGGHMNARISSDELSYLLKEVPFCFEGGTQNIAGIFGFEKAIDFINKIGLDNIIAYEQQLKQYAVEQFNLKLKDKIIIYNPDAETGLLVFNVKNKFAQDVATHLGTINHITVRSGEHCSKLINQVIGESSTVRVSFSIYNNKEEIDKLVLALVNEQDFLGRLV